MLIHLWRTLQISSSWHNFKTGGIHASINYVRGCTHSSSSSVFFFPLRRSHLIGPSPIFLEHGALSKPWNPEYASLWSCAPLKIYICGSWTMAQQYGIKIEVLLGTSYGTHWEIEEHFANLTKTAWELDGKTLRTLKKKSTTPPAPAPKEKNYALLSLLIGCIKFLFPKQFVIIFNLN